MAKEIKKITSFTVDHRYITPGIYVSRIDGDVTTYDLRTRRPNCGDYMDDSTMHSMEHLFATYIRNSAIADRVIYFGPMGCQTGFYLLIRNADNAEVLSEMKEVLRLIVEHEGEVFGASEIECGNYRTLNAEKAKAEAAAYLDYIESHEQNFEYPKGEAK